MEFGLVEYVNIDNMIVKCLYILIYPESSFRCLILALGWGVMRGDAPPPGLFRARRGASEGGDKTYRCTKGLVAVCMAVAFFGFVFFSTVIRYTLKIISILYSCVPDHMCNKSFTIRVVESFA